MALQRCARDVVRAALAEGALQSEEDGGGTAAREREKAEKKERKEKKRRRRDGGPEASGLSGPTEISGETTRMS